LPKGRNNIMPPLSGGIEPTENWVNVALNKALAARNYKTAPTISGRCGLCG